MDNYFVSGAIYHSLNPCYDDDANDNDNDGDDDDDDDDDDNGISCCLLATLI